MGCDIPAPNHFQTSQHWHIWIMTFSALPVLLLCCEIRGLGELPFHLVLIQLECQMLTQLHQSTRQEKNGSGKNGGNIYFKAAYLNSVFRHIKFCWDLRQGRAVNTLLTIYGQLQTKLTSPRLCNITFHYWPKSVILNQGPKLGKRGIFLKFTEVTKVKK